jgi:glycosyltransferase involved in cell wall biosynthesis
MKTTLLVPTLNELESIQVIMPRVKKEWCHQIIIVDGGSTDGTVEWARQNGYFVYIQKEPGMRKAYTEALPYVEGDVLITFSPDGNSIPELIPELVKKMGEGYDMVIASRYLGDAKSEDDDLITAFGNWFFTKSINLLHGGHYTDTMVMYRAYKTQVIYDLELNKDEGYRMAERIFQTHIGWEPLLSVRAAKRKLRVTEIPGDEPPRIGGKRKLQIFKWGGALYFQVLREIFFWR